MHNEAEIALDRMMSEAKVSRTQELNVLDVGGRQVNDSVRYMLPSARWLGLDIKPGPNVDIVADARIWEPPHQFDVVVCTEVFEHVKEWREILRTCARATKSDDGFLFVTCASIGRPSHGAEGTEVVPDGEHYANVSISDLTYELKQLFWEVHTTYAFPPGDAYAWARICILPNAR